MSYQANLSAALNGNRNFAGVCRYHARRYPSGGYSKFQPQLGRGTAIIACPEVASAYLAHYGDIHRIKMQHAFCKSELGAQLRGATINIVDWGCGQALATCTMLDVANSHDWNIKTKSVHLIDPSPVSLDKAQDHMRILHPIHRIFPHQKTANAMTKADFSDSPHVGTHVHLFSNILDLETVDLNHLAQLIGTSFPGNNYIICVGPRNKGATRIAQFAALFANKTILADKLPDIPAIIYRPSLERYIHSVVRSKEVIIKITC